MIINNWMVEGKFRCTKPIMEYLVYKCNIPILSFDNKYYYFAHTNELEASLDRMPLHLKLRSVLSAVFLQD